MIIFTADLTNYVQDFFKFITMNRIILIGNGFDLAHGLDTRYVDFINKFWEYQVEGANKFEDWKGESGNFVFENDFLN